MRASRRARKPSAFAKGLQTAVGYSSPSRRGSNLDFAARPTRTVARWRPVSAARQSQGREGGLSTNGMKLALTAQARWRAAPSIRRCATKRRPAA